MRKAWLAILVVVLGVACICAQDESISDYEVVRLTDLSERAYHPRWAVDGSFLIYTRNVGSESTLWTMPAGGGESAQIPLRRNGDLSFALSPTGEEIVFDTFANNVQPPYDLYIYNLASEEARVLTDASGNQLHPSWSPDGAWICFSQRELHMIPTSGGASVRLSPEGEEAWHPAWSPDGKTIAFTSDRTGNAEIYVLDVAERTIEQLTNASGYDDRACWSPDGSRIAFVSDRAGDGNDDLWILTLADGSLEQVTHGSGAETHPAWSPDGSRIAFSIFKWPDADVGMLDLGD